MAGADASKLYTPEILALAVDLARHPLDDRFALRGEARSRTCGSRITLGLVQDLEGRVAHVGLAVQACAIGQAAAALFAAGVTGRAPEELEQAGSALARWLAGEGPLPDWPGLEALVAARGYPARHGAILLPWKAAQAALGKAGAAG